MRHDRRGTAAAEMAMVLPLLLIIMFGSIELGNYFMNEHTLVKSVRDGARFAARQSFGNYASCSGQPSSAVVTDTVNVVMNGVVSGGTIITPNIKTDDVKVTTRCTLTLDGQTMSGIYQNRAGGAQVVMVDATVDYRPVLGGAFGFSGADLKLRAASEAAVSGI